MVIDLPPLFPAQREIADDPHRFKVVAAGRRFGKTKLAALMCVQVALTGGKAWWVAPSFPLADIGWREIKRLCVQIPGAYPRLATRTYFTPGGGFVQARSAVTEAGLRGEGLDFVVIDECAFMAYERWSEELRPALSDRNGGAMFISTPKGRNWFWKLWLMGRSDKHPDWASWQLPSTARPTFDPKELLSAEQEMPYRVFQQEYLAQFMSESGVVFGHVDEIATSTPLYEAAEDRTYVAGMDLGRYEDATVVSVIDVGSKEQVYLERMQGIGWDLQSAKCAAIQARFNLRAWMIEKNFNESHVDSLKADGLPVVSFHSSNTSKSVIINDLALAMESGECRILPDETQLHELKAYTFTTTKSGLTRYHAPEGDHDDTVIALALAWAASKEASFKSASTYGMRGDTRVAHASRPGPLGFHDRGTVAGRYNSPKPRPGSRVSRRLTRRR